MSIFLNGDFKIQNSWDKRSGSKDSRCSKNRSKSRDNNSLVNAARQVLSPTPDILDKQMASRVFKEFQAQMPPMPASCRSEKKIPGSREGSRSKLPPRQKTINSNEDIVTSMAGRLRKVQEINTSQKKQIKDKDQIIEKLRNQNNFLKGFRENSESAYKKFETLQRKNKELEEKVKQMEQYLKKYGMKWVGKDKIEGKFDHEKMKKDIANNRHNYRLPSEIDLATIQRRVQELNAGLQSQGQGTQIYSENGIHKFRKAEPLPMAFYGDGIAIKGFNFYPYKSKQSLKILSDLVDGYFPYVLKGKYPNGVFINVVDMINEKYSNQQNSQNVVSMDSMKKNQFQPQSKDQFLNKLPKEVIKNGKIIPIRAEIQKQMNGIAEQKPLEHAKLCQQIDGCYVFKTAVHTKLQSSQVKQQDVCILKIRTQEGKICILQLQPESTVKQVYQWMKNIVKNKFKLMGNYPRRVYQEEQADNLKDLGLTPNAILHIQKIQ